MKFTEFLTEKQAILTESLINKELVKEVNPIMGSTTKIGKFLASNMKIAASKLESFTRMEVPARGVKFNAEQFTFSGKLHPRKPALVLMILNDKVVLVGACTRASGAQCVINPLVAWKRGAQDEFNLIHEDAEQITRIIRTSTDADVPNITSFFYTPVEASLIKADRAGVFSGDAETSSLRRSREINRAPDLEKSMAASHERRVNRVMANLEVVKKPYMTLPENVRKLIEECGMKPDFKRLYGKYGIMMLHYTQRGKEQFMARVELHSMDAPLARGFVYALQLKGKGATKEEALKRLQEEVKVDSGSSGDYTIEETEKRIAYLQNVVKLAKLIKNLKVGDIPVVEGSEYD